MAYESESLKLNLGTSNNTTDSANLLNPGEWMEGALSSAGDVDFYKVSAKAGLLTLDFKSPLVSSTARWKIELLNAGGDLVRTLSTSATGSSLSMKAESSTATNKQVTITGLTSTLSIGSQFTLVTAGADTTVYTIVSVDSRSGSGYTVTLDRAYNNTTATSIAFDPAYLSSTGAAGQVAALLPTDGVYYLKVSAIGWTDADYALRAAVLPAAEATDNDDVYDARDDNSRLVANLSHTGALSSATDTDVWLLTTAQASNFSIDFTGTSTKTKFHVTVQTWSPSGTLETARAPGGVLLDGKQIEGSKSFAIDTTVYPTGTTFAVSIKVDSASDLDTASGGGNYTLKASGTSLDSNDTPIIQIAGYSSGEPETYDTSLVEAITRSFKAGESSKVALNTLFTTTDADAGQTLGYKFWYVTTATGNTPVSTGAIKVEKSGQLQDYAYGSLMSADDLQSAYLYTGTTQGSYVLRMLALDSSNAPDNSGHSAYMGQTIRVVNAAKGVQVATDNTLSLVEGATSSSAGYSETLTISLTEAPASAVTINLVDAGNQFEISATQLVFTNTDAQTVTIRARSDGKKEDAHTGSLTFTVVSSDPDYNGMAVADPDGNPISSLSFALSDPGNSAPEGAVTLSSTTPSQGDTLTSESTLSDADGLGNLNYQWQRSSDGSSWTDIADANASSYKAVSADAAKKLRVQVSYVDGLGKIETVNSAATDAVIKTNEPPTTKDASLAITRGAGYSFKTTDFPFVDSDANDALSSVVIYTLPTSGQLKLDGLDVTAGYRLTASEIAKLLYTPADGSGRQNLSLSFAVGDSKDELSGTGTLTLQINSRPTAQPQTVSTNEDTTLTLKTADFGFIDTDGDSLASVTITSLPAVGKLKLGSSDVTAEQVVAVADIAAGQLRYTPADNTSGSVTLAFKVSDGLATASTTTTLTLAVAAVDDAPTFSGIPATPVAAQPAKEYALTGLAVADVDSDNLSLSLTAEFGRLFGLSDADAQVDGVQLSGTAAQINAALAGARFIPTAAGAGLGLSLKAGDLTTTSSYNFNVSAPANANDLDGDGLSNAAEGKDSDPTKDLDRNADGRPDWLQPHVGSTTVNNIPVSVVLGTSAAPVEMKGVSQTAYQSTVADLQELLGLLSTSTGLVTAGASVPVNVLLPSSTDINGLWLEAGDTLYNVMGPAFGGQLSTLGEQKSLSFNVTEGGMMDADGQANGTLVLDIVPGKLDNLSLVGLLPDLPDNGFWI